MATLASMTTGAGTIGVTFKTVIATMDAIIETTEWIARIAGRATAPIAIWTIAAAAKVTEVIGATRAVPANLVSPTGTKAVRTVLEDEGFRLEDQLCPKSPFRISGALKIRNGFFAKLSLFLAPLNRLHLYPAENRRPTSPPVFLP